MALGERVSHLESGALVVCFIVVAFAGVVTSGLFSDCSSPEGSCAAFARKDADITSATQDASADEYLSQDSI